MAAGIVSENSIARITTTTGRRHRRRRLHRRAVAAVTLSPLSPYFPTSLHTSIRRTPRQPQPLLSSPFLLLFSNFKRKGDRVTGRRITACRYWRFSVVTVGKGTVTEGDSGGNGDRILALAIARLSPLATRLSPLVSQR